MPDTDRKVAIVTGASSGIGFALTDMLLRRGLAVVANGRTCRETLTETSALRLRTDDLLDPATPAALLDAALAGFGRIDYLFVNAGTIEAGPIADIDIDKMCRMVRLKVEAAFRLIYTVLKRFLEQGTGHVFITSSVLGTKTRESAGAYAACNHALEALAEALRMELADTAVQITCIEPGLVKTGLHRDWPIHPQQSMHISHALAPRDIAEAVEEIMDKPAYVRIPRYMILPRGHRI